MVFLACHASALVVDYGFNDDYYDLVALEGGWPFRQKILNGRPLHALGTELFLRTATDVGDLRYVRLIGVVGIALVAWSLFRALVRAGCGRFVSFCVGATICCALPFQVYAAWMTTALYPWAALLSGIAFSLSDRAFDAARRRSKTAAAIGASLVLTAALAIYQPAAMFFWVFTAIALLTPQAPRRDLLRRFRWHAVICAASTLAGFVLVKSGSLLYPDHSIPRTRLVQDFLAKAEWFVLEALQNALNFAWFPLNGLVSSALFAIIAGGLLSYFPDAPGGRARKLCIAAALLPLACLPNLVVAENWADYRTLPGLASLFALYGCLALSGYARRLRCPPSSVGAHVVAGCAAIACILSAALNVTTFARSQNRELAVMRSRLTPESLAGRRSIYLIRSRSQDSLFPSARREFRRPSSLQSWSAPAMARLLLRETAADAHLPIVTIGADEPVMPPRDALVVDMRELRQAAERLQAES